MALGSLLAGASLVHSIFKPDLHIPIGKNNVNIIQDDLVLGRNDGKNKNDIP